jgi:hypothetical protein
MNQNSLRPIIRLVSVLGVLVTIAVGCGASVCSGDSCDCPANETCDFGNKTTAKFTCQSGSTCTGTGGAGSNVVCSGASCTVTVGAGSNVTCASGTCNITCNGACTVACGATCNITCGGGTSSTSGGCS